MIHVARINALGFLCGCTLLWAAGAQASVHGDFDQNVCAMSIDRASIEPEMSAGALGYIDRTIPRLIHRIDFSPRSAGTALSDAAWAAYATKLGYQLRIWGEHDLAELETLMELSYNKLFVEALQAGHWRFANQLARVAVLVTLGGIYADDSVWPPHRRGAWVDFDQLVPMEGLILTADRLGRNIGRTSLFVQDSLLLTAPEHPVFQHMKRNVVANHTSVQRAPSELSAPYDGAGVFLLNRALAGAFSLVAITHWQSLGAVDDAAGALALLSE